MKMKLNQNGWGMATFLVIVGLLFFLILLIALLANDYDNGLPSSSRNQITIVKEKNLDRNI